MKSKQKKQVIRQDSDAAAASSKTQARRSSGSGKIGGQGKSKDTATSLVFKNADNFADVFNHTIFASEQIAGAELSEDNIKEIALLRVTKDTHTALTQYRDTIKYLKGDRWADQRKGQRKDQPKAILGIEHQSEQSFQMPFRVLEMDFINYARQIRTIMERNVKKMAAQKLSAETAAVSPVSSSDLTAVSKQALSAQAPAPQPNSGEFLDRYYQDDRLIPCITLVIYWGAEPWQGPRSLSEMFGQSPMAAYASDYGMYLLEVQQISDAELATYGKELRAIFGFVKYARDKTILQEFLAQNAEDFSELSETVLDAIAELVHTPELKKLKAAKYGSVTKGGNYNMFPALKEWLEDERNEGRAEGRAEGIKEGIKEERMNTERERMRADAAEQELRILKAQLGHS